MKTLKITFIALILICNLTPSKGQGVWKQYQWEYYNIKFELPDYFQVDINNEEALKASSEGINFALYPFKDSELNGRDLAGFIINLAEDDLNLSEIDDMQLIEVDGMKGGFVSGSKGGMLYMVLGLIDPETNNNFYAIVAFDSDQEDVIEDALEVFESFGKMQ